MDFYNSTDAKKYARNKTRIIKEINDIEETIAENVDRNEFSCDVYNTVMTDDRNEYEPSITAQAHCIMELNSLNIAPAPTEMDILDGDYAIQTEPIDEVDAGNAPDFFPTRLADGGFANEETEQQGNFRVGETLVLRDREDANPIEIKITEVTETGDIEDIEIVSRGEFEEEIIDSGYLVYKDTENYLDINTDYGSIGDIRIDRDEDKTVTIKDIADIASTETVVTTWYDTNDEYDIDSYLPDTYGTIGTRYVVNPAKSFIKLPKDGYISGKWEMVQNIYHYRTFELPNDFGSNWSLSYQVPLKDGCKNFVKTSYGWKQVNHYIDLGMSERPNPTSYADNTVVVYYDVASTKHILYKNIEYTQGWINISVEYDWSDVPPYTFGKRGDIFVYNNFGEDEYIYHDGISWKDVIRTIKWEDLHNDNTFGSLHDVIKYDGEYAVQHTYVKIKAQVDVYPTGKWVKVDKIWDLNQYLIGSTPVPVTMNWNVKNVVMDKIGDGYIYDTSVVFSSGSASAVAVLNHDKISEVKVVNGGGDYTTEIPTVSFTMPAPDLPEKYYKVWKRLMLNPVLQDEMEQVIDYFDKTKTYTISRVTSSNGKTFHWHISWN